MTTSTNQRRAFPLHRATFVAIVSMLAAFLSTTGPPAHAEPAANDAWESATEVTSVRCRSWLVGEPSHETSSVGSVRTTEA